MSEKLEIGEREINLIQVLKVTGLADSGGQAQTLVSDGLVRVNGAVESRKRRKMQVGDVVTVEGGGQVELV